MYIYIDICIYIYIFIERETDIWAIKNVKYIELQRICFFFFFLAVMMTEKTGIIGVGSHPAPAAGPLTLAGVNKLA